MSYILQHKQKKTYHTGKLQKNEGKLVAILDRQDNARHYKTVQIAKKICRRLNALCDDQFEIIQL